MYKQISVFRVYIVSDLTSRKTLPKKDSGALGRKRRAQFDAFLNESRKFMKKYFKSTGSGNAERQSADRPIRRQDKSADTDNQKILKHRGRKIFVCPGAQDTLATPLRMTASYQSGIGTIII